MKPTARLQHQEPFKGSGRLRVNSNPCCGNCGVESRVRHRDFSEQVWSVLLVWGEINKESVDQQFCDDCYRDLRDILIERGPEMEALIRGGSPTSDVAVATKAAPKAPTPKKGRPKIAS